MAADPLLKGSDMGTILCATRGGEASYSTQDAVIAIAKQQGDALVFLYVVDVGFLDQTSAPMVIDVESRLEKLGRFQLKMAQERAAIQEVVAQAIVRQGQLKEELAEVAREVGATLIVFGRPLKPTAFFDESALQEFVGDLQTETGIEVRVVGGQ
jgi:nucleotide-binding universal stress UspA family protein